MSMFCNHGFNPRYIDYLTFGADRGILRKMGATSEEKRKKSRMTCLLVSSMQWPGVVQDVSLRKASSTQKPNSVARDKYFAVEETGVKVDGESLWWPSRNT